MKAINSLPCAESCHSKPQSIFRHLTNDVIEKLLSFKETYQSRRGNVIYTEGSRITGCYCISAGIIKIYKTGSDGKEQIIRFAKSGELIGFRSVFNNEAACTTAQVLEDSVLCHIPGDLMVQFVKLNGNFAMDLLQLACKELGEANSYITDIAQKTVRERLAEVLLNLKENFGLNQSQVLQISLTREELANIVGTATESVIRLLSEFKEDNIIELQGRQIRILNNSALSKLANL
jgi:CRP/FNR family transcriptional regulator, polysaccharide utilization system transcription regulator